MAAPRFTRVRALRVVGSATLALGSVLIPAAQATARVASTTCDTSWKTAVDGDWADATKWTAGVPDDTTSACIDVGGRYVVHLTRAGLARSLRLGRTHGAQTLDIVSSCHSGAGLTVGGDATIKPSGTLRLTERQCDHGLTVELDNGGTFDNHGTIDLDGPTTGGSPVILFGTVKNAGRIVLRAGSQTEMDGTMTNLPSATLEVHLSAHAAGGYITPPGNGGFIHLGGTLALVRDESFVPALHQQFPLCNLCGGRGGGRFATVTGQDLPSGDTITLVYSRGHGMFPPSLTLKVA